jgi:uncharacterized glyoxalase superfamily protein PhnB
MTDPLTVLRLPVAPIAPDPQFASRLRARIAGTLTHPSSEHEAAPAGGVAPYLGVIDARRALEWYVEALGARRRGELIVMADGRIGHAELEVAGGVVMLADESPESNLVAPRPDGAVPVSLHLRIPDVDVAVDRAVRAGARLERSLADSPSGRNAVLRDPFGHRWIVSGPALAGVRAAEVSPPSAEPIRHGDIGYVSLWVPDVERAALFFSRALGWTYAPGSGPPGRQVRGVSPSHGLWGGHDRSTLFVCYAVDDVDDTAARVRAAGGSAEEPADEPYGRTAMCADDQGVPFAIFEPPPEATTPRPALNGTRQGELAYLTLEVADSARARAFFRAVLEWQFVPGRVADGWTVEDVAPMVGLGGGRPPVGVPMYRVDDIAAAVQRVRAAGGTATDPEQQPYGISSECGDDQGTRFYLGQL